MGLKTAALWYLISKDPSDRDATTRMLSVLDKFEGLPNGMFSADEHYGGRNPSQGVELCAVVESMFSLELDLGVLGDPALGDRIEKIAFNALPGAQTADQWSHQYDQQPNQVLCSLGKRDWSSNGPESNLFGLEPNFRLLHREPASGLAEIPPRRSGWRRPMADWRWPRTPPARSARASTALTWPSPRPPIIPSATAFP